MEEQSMTMNTWPGWQNDGLIGEGSFGKVFRIRREEFGRSYEAALKVIRIPHNEADIRAAYEEGMDDKSVTEYFRSCVEDIVAEFALMSQLKGNSNIVSYEDHMVVQHEDGIGWDILIRMELLTPLLTYIRTNPMEEDDVVQLGIDISRALKLCRKKGILHRDIKPENIFVSNDGDFKLGDFGVARVAEKTVSAMSKKGTYTYMAPEVYKGEKYGFAADLYSLGMVLYRFLNDNRLPYMPPAPQPIQFRDRERALNARVMGQPMDAPAHGKEELKAVVMKSCAYEQKDRFSSAEELEQALMALQKPVSSQSGWGSVAQEDDDWEEDDDFEKTVSSVYGYKPVKKTAPVKADPEEDFTPFKSAEHSWNQDTKRSEPKKEESAWKQDSFSQSGWGSAVQEDDDDWEEDDDFEKTVSSVFGYKPVKKTAPVKEDPEEDFTPFKSAEHSWNQDTKRSEPKKEESAWNQESKKQDSFSQSGWGSVAQDETDDWGDEDDFDKTVSTFSTRKPMKKAAQPEPEPEEVFMDEDEDEDEFDRTVSAFHAKPMGKSAQGYRSVVTPKPEIVPKTAAVSKPEGQSNLAQKVAADKKETTQAKNKPKGLLARLFGGK